MKKLFQRIDLFLNNLYTNNTTQTVREMVLQYLDVLVNGEYSGLTNNKFHFVETNKETGTVHQDTEGYKNFNQYTYTRETTGNPVYLQNYTLPFEAVQNFSQIKICMDTVANQESILPANIRVYNSGSSYSTMTKANFLATYGDFVMFDYKKFNLTYPVAAPYSLLRLADASGNLITEDLPVALQLQKGNDKINFGLIYTPAGSVTDYYRAPESGFGCSEIFKVFNTGNNVVANRLFLIYSAIKGQVDTNSNNIFTMMGNYGKRFASTSGSNYSFMWKKEIIDEYLVDLMDATRIVASYTGNIESPEMPEEAIETAPGQDELTVDNTGGTGDFSSDTIENQQSQASQVAGMSGTTYIYNLPTHNLVKAALWDQNFISLLKDLSGTAQGAVVNCLLFPFNLHSILSGQTTVSSLYLGTHEVELSGTAEAYAVSTGSKCEVEVGPLSNFKKVLGGFLDDNGVSETFIHLPFIGLKQIDPEIVYGHDVYVKYIFDLITGECQALVESNMTTAADGKTFTSDKVVCYEFSGQAGIQIAFCESNINQMMMSVGINALRGGMTGGTAGALMGATEGAVQMIGSASAHMEGATGSSIERQKSMDIYLLFIRPKTAIPQNYNKTKGRPSSIVSTLSNLKGFTVVNDPIIETTATDAEREQIIQLLKEGVRIK